YYLLKVIRDPLILAEGDPELKAYTNAMQAGVLMIVVPLFARIYHQIGTRGDKHFLIRRIMLFFISNLVLFALAYAAGWRIAIPFYVWLGVFSVMVLALFWAFSADLYNIKSGQRIFPVIAAAASGGAYMGAKVAGSWDPVVGHDGVIFSAALLLLVPWWLSGFVERNVPAGSKSIITDEFHEHPVPISEGFMVVFRSYYLTMIAFFVITMNLINTNGEYILSTFVSQTADSLFASADLAASRDTYITNFYSSYFAWFTLLGFLIQLFLVARIFDKVGIRGALLILPAIMMVSYSLILIFPLLAVVRYAMITENSISYSLQNTTRHALFLPVRRQEKYVGKHCIDTFFFRFGDVLSAAAVFLGSAVLGMQLSGFVVANMGLAVLLFWFSWIIGKRNQSVIETNFGNMPPQVAMPLPDMDIPAGEISQFVMDEDTFVDPDEGDALTYLAFQEPAGKLPSWVNFDAFTRQFKFNPPANSQGTLEIRVVARDFDGLEAQSSFKVRYRNLSPDGG
ncbi:MAG: putative Ig domain-containing protein, partial [Gammaproteobacteria bacterium]|nr:putative Ig domain-containing protein [Gammaproteobacteria bacterium]